MPNEDKLIEHLSSEITTQATYLATFRSRIAFTVLIGPFVLLGSFIVANHGSSTKSDFNNHTVVALIVAFSCYVGLGIYGGCLDKHANEQCDKWRRLIIRISQGETIQDSDFAFQHQSIYRWVPPCSRFFSTHRIHRLSHLTSTELAISGMGV
jgi:hypothetical protein